MADDQDPGDATPAPRGRDSHGTGRGRSNRPAGASERAESGKRRGKQAGLPAGPVGAAESRPDTAGRANPSPATVLHKRDFIARVGTSCDLPHAQLRRAVEATLAELGRAIAAGETLALPPFGKARVSRQKTVRGSEVLVLRLRRPGPGAGIPDTHPDLAPDDEY